MASFELPDLEKIYLKQQSKFSGAQVKQPTVKELLELMATFDFLPLSLAERQKKQKQRSVLPGGKAIELEIQKRPRCFQKEKINVLRGAYYGSVVKDVKNGEGYFEWIDGFVAEGIWRDGDLNGFCKLRISELEPEKWPKPLDPKQYNTTPLGYRGYVKSNRFHGKGVMMA
jgi:hypothetical protein